MPDVTVQIIENNALVNVNESVVNVNIDEQIATVNIGLAGPQGPRGTGILNGSGAPDEYLGINGDFYLDVDTMELYGPKNSLGWGPPVDLVGNSELGYVHEQSVASDTWTINHGLGFIPNITVIDSAGTVVEGSYNYSEDGNTVTLSFVGSFSGKAYLS